MHVDESRQYPVPAQAGDEEALVIRHLAGADRVDRLPGQPDPAGVEYAVGRHHARASQQADRGHGPGGGHDQAHQARMTERDRPRGWSGSMPFRSASGSASEVITVAPVRRASASRSAGIAPSAQTTVFSSLTLIGPCRYSIAGY